MWDDDYDNNNRSSRTNTSERGVNSLASDFSKLERKHEKLALATEAMWEILRDKLGYSNADLRKKIKEIDLRDGKEDGKVTKTAIECPKCLRKISMQHKKCMYCDIKVDDGSIF